MNTDELKAIASARPITHLLDLQRRYDVTVLQDQGGYKALDRITSISGRGETSALAVTAMLENIAAENLRQLRTLDHDTPDTAPGWDGVHARDDGDNW